MKNNNIRLGHIVLSGELLQEATSPSQVVNVCPSRLAIVNCVIIMMGEPSLQVSTDFLTYSLGISLVTSVPVIRYSHM